MEDYLRDEAGAPKVSNGDFVRGDSSQQQAEKVIDCQKGCNRQYPESGFGITKYLKGQSDPKHFERELRVELIGAGFSTAEVNIDNNFNLEIKV
ncbi:MAG: hypothetical protein N4A72_06250 [Bacteroidales bacterium]|jgi:hypothetical protein|nr:hypothetical protein [Bacteroidales bacterium]